MARINIEDCWWTDPRRERLTELVGGPLIADGAAIRMWRLAQEFWKHARGLVPQGIFATLPYAAEMIKSGLASATESMVYVRGSSQYLDWLHDKKLAGREGGRKSSQRPRDAKGRLLKTDKSIQAESKQTSKQSPSNSKQSQASYSSSSSFSKDIKQSLLNLVERAPSKAKVGDGLSPSLEEEIQEGQRKLQRLRSKQGLTPSWPGGKL